jgi:hypothetical protein
MKLIAHRGNLDGKHPSKENHPEYIDAAIFAGYDSEIDLRSNGTNLFLGHNGFEYQISTNYLLDRIDKLWVHCKDRQAFDIALQYNLNCFWHSNDDYTLTKAGYVWAFPGKFSTEYNCVMVLPETVWSLKEIVNFKTFGICSDIVKKIKESYDSLV